MARRSKFREFCLYAGIFIGVFGLIMGYNLEWWWLFAMGTACAATSFGLLVHP